MAAGREHGGATKWLTAKGNVTPGETMEVRFAIWDTSDSLYDSVLLIDGWRWSESTAQAGIENCYPTLLSAS